MSYFIVMRHSKRLDNVANGRWHDMDSRPYDTPISCERLPADQGRKLIEYGIKKVVVSPFRRCLQTAAIVCEQIGVTEITIDRGVGESMSAVRRINNTCLPADAPKEAHSLQYLSFEESHQTIRELNQQLEITDIVGDQPAYTEGHGEGYVRYMQTACRYLDRMHVDCDHGSVLVVSHGDTVASIGDLLCSHDVYSVNECGFIVVKTVAASNRAGTGAVEGESGDCVGSLTDETAHPNADTDADASSGSDGNGADGCPGATAGADASAGAGARGVGYSCRLHTCDAVYIRGDPLGANPTSTNTFHRSRVPSTVSTPASPSTASSPGGYSCSSPSNDCGARETLSTAVQARGEHAGVGIPSAAEFTASSSTAAGAAGADARGCTCS